MSAKLFPSCPEARIKYQGIITLSPYDLLSNPYHLTAIVSFSWNLKSMSYLDFSIPVHVCIGYIQLQIMFMRFGVV